MVGSTGEKCDIMKQMRHQENPTHLVVDRTLLCFALGMKVLTGGATVLFYRCIGFGIHDTWGTQFYNKAALNCNTGQKGMRPHKDWDVWLRDGV